MTRLLVSVLALLMLTSPVLAQQAPPKPSDLAAPDHTVLLAHWRSLQTSLADVGNDLEKYLQDVKHLVDVAQAKVNEAEAQKQTLIDWLKDAQAREAPPKGAAN